MKVLCANDIDGDIHKQISEIFVDGFYQWLKFFSKDKQKLANALEHMFNLNVFYVALIDDKIAGMAALNNGKERTVRMSKKEFQKHLGFLRGFMAYQILKREFEEKEYPFEMKPKTGYVEFVATSPDMRGKGVASAIIEYFFALSEYDEYILEVADTNANAVRLYEKLGFREFMRVEMKNKKQSGVNYLVYMGRCGKLYQNDLRFGYTDKNDRCV